MSLLWYTVLAIFCSSFIEAQDQVHVIDEWRNLDFTFDSPEQQRYAIEKGFYNHDGQKRPYDADIFIAANGTWLKFISIPRVSDHVPFTLATIDDGYSGPAGPLLRAYPSMDWHLERSCDGLFAVFRIWIDNHCKRLWVIDSGRDFFAKDKTQTCPPKIVAFDLHTNQMLMKYEIPSDQYISEVSVFSSITLDPFAACHKSLAYITDVRGPGLVVFSLKQFVSWKTENELYRADPNYHMVTIAGEQFNFTDGVYSVAPNIFTNEVYFHPFASIYEMSVPRPILNNPIFWSSEEVPTELFFRRIGERTTQSASEAVDSRGNLWFTLLDPLAILCWNPINPYAMEFFKTVTVDEDNLQFVAGLKIRDDPAWGEILVGISNRLQKHNTGTVNPNEINYSLFIMPIEHIDCTDV